MKVYVVLMDAHNDMSYEDHWYTTNQFIGAYASMESAAEAVMERTTKERIYEHDFDYIEDEYRNEWFEDRIYNRTDMNLKKSEAHDDERYHVVSVYYEDYGNVTADYYIKPCEI